MADEMDKSWNIFGKKNMKDKHDSQMTSNTSKENGNEINHPVGPKISRPTTSTHYKNDHPNIGVALVFNHTNVQGQSIRLGTDKDRHRVKKTLRGYGFDVRIYDDKPYGEIDEILDKVSKEDHSKNDCLAIVVMSHGTTGQIFAEDMAYPVEKLWNPFLGENCKTLINKPKLFFIQACRGEKLDPGAQYTDTFSVMARSRSGSDETDGLPVTFTIPCTADLLIYYSTFEGNYSWRNPSNGSWFIQSLSAILEDHAKEEEFDLLHALTAVNRKVAYEYQSNVPKDERLDEMKSMPNFVSTLTKIFLMRTKP